VLWRKTVGKPVGRWDYVVWRDDMDYLQIGNWHGAARETEVWRKETGEAMAQKRTEAS
jgi:hypothetical protein